MTSADIDAEVKLSFLKYHLFDQLSAALLDLKWEFPTEIQDTVIPLILEKKNVLACAQTGSGKTGAYIIPIIQRILLDSQSANDSNTVTTLILAPTKELCFQVDRNLKDLSKYCSKLVRCVNVTGQSRSVLLPHLQNKPNVIVGTPSSVLQLISTKSVDLSNLQMLVVDEADLMFGFGYSKEMESLCSHFSSNNLQAIMLSATLGKDVKSLRKVVLKGRKAVWSRVELAGETALPGSNQLTQYILSCLEDDKLLLIYALLKLKLVRGKTLLFVNSVDRGYRVKLFLEQFGIRSVVLNAELPTSCRLHVVSQFNRGLYDILIASDEAISNESARAAHKRKKDKEFGVSRGIDFQLVSNVINFDFPDNLKSYQHRVGRAGRADQCGTALSFVSEKDSEKLSSIQTILTDLRPFQFKMEELDGFRYRARDAAHAVTSASVREARMREIRHEMLQSTKLRSYFQDNPRDLDVLRHDKQVHNVKVHPHLKNVPEYIVPNSLRDMMSVRRGRQRHRQPTADQKRRQNKANDPLFSAKAALQLGIKKRKR